MFSAMSGTSERMSTMPASAMVFAGEICGGASANAAAVTTANAQPSEKAASLERIEVSKTVRVERSGAKLREVETLSPSAPALRLRAFGATLWANGIRSQVLVTSALLLEREVLVVIAEIGIRIDLGHVQRAAGLDGEIQPGLGIAMKPVHEVLVADAHDFAREVGRFLRGKLHLVAARADVHLAEPGIAPYAEFAFQLGRRGGFARGRVGHARDAAPLVGALQFVGVALDTASLVRRGEMFGQHLVEHRARVFGFGIDQEHIAAVLEWQQRDRRVHAFQRAGVRHGHLAIDVADAPAVAVTPEQRAVPFVLALRDRHRRVRRPL